MTIEAIRDSIEFETFNPWNVLSLNAFRYHCCPECDYRIVIKSNFIQHAVNNHPRSQETIGSLEGNNIVQILKALADQDLFEDFEFEEKFNPWNVTSLDDFLYYCCPECDTKTVTKSEFIGHAVNNHPRSQDIIDSLEGKGSKAVTDIENNVIHHESDVIDETMDIGETKPELTNSNFITKVKHEIIKVEPCVDDVNRRLKEAIVVLPKLSDETIRKYIK